MPETSLPPTPSQRDRVLDALASRRRATVRQLAAAADMTPKATASVLSRLARDGEVRKLGRGIAAVADDRPGAPHTAGVTLPRDARTIVEALDAVGLPAQLSGLDVLLAFSNQLPAGWPHLVLVDRGDGDWAADTLRPHGFRAVVDPVGDQLRLAVDLVPDGLVVIRERRLPAGGGAVRSTEEAWVDLAVERRAGYPIGTTELGGILNGMVDAGVSWPRLARTARRRGLPLTVDLDAGRIPLRAADGAQHADLARMVAG